MNPIVHFEMPYSNQDRLCKFYASAFGWQMNKTGPEMGDYVVVTTTEIDQNRMVKTPGTINGGFFPKQPNGPQHPSVVVAVDDIKDAINKVKSAGGKVVGEPIEIPGIGMYVSFDDTEGNRASILQPFKR